MSMVHHAKSKTLFYTSRKKEKRKEERTEGRKKEVMHGGRKVRMEGGRNEEAKKTEKGRLN